MARLRQEGVDLDPLDSASTVKLLGLAKVTHRGATLDGGVMTVWPREGIVLRNEWEQPGDGILLKVSEVAELQEPIVIMSRRLRGDRAATTQIPGQSTGVSAGAIGGFGRLADEVLFWPVLPENVLTLPVRRGQTVGAVLQTWGETGRRQSVFFSAVPLMKTRDSKCRRTK